MNTVGDTPGVRLSPDAIAWERFFDRVAGHLNRNGVFAFDITTVPRQPVTGYSA